MPSDEWLRTSGCRRKRLGPFAILIAGWADHCRVLIAPSPYKRNQNQNKVRLRRCGDVSFGSVEVASAVADLVRDSLRYMLAVQAVSEMEQGATGVPVSV
jgi:hypothetical protein